MIKAIQIHTLMHISRKDPKPRYQQAFRFNKRPTTSFAHSSREIGKISISGQQSFSADSLECALGPPRGENKQRSAEIISRASLTVKFPVQIAHLMQLSSRG